MYTQLVIHYPALGKSAELRAALGERNSAANAAAPHSLRVSMFALEPAFIHAIRFDSLAAIEAYQEQQQSDATFHAAVQKITQCLSRPQGILLLEQIVGTGPAAAPKFLIVNRFCPAPGKVAELRGVLEERIRRSHPAYLAAAGLNQQVASSDGPAFTVALVFASMAAIDDYRAANAKDPDFQSFLNQAASLSRTPVQQSMQRILAPFPV